MKRHNVNMVFKQLFLVVLMADAALPAQQTRQDNVATSRIEELRSARKEAAHRKRRIIFNNDGNEPVVFLKEASAQALLDCRTTPLLGSQVDSIFYCTWSA